eukprot:SAG31_NODE_3588_length_4093_cov_4.550075_1_plen_280_part_00
MLEAYPTPAAALAQWDGLVLLGSPFSVRNWEYPGAEGLGGTVGPALDIDAMLELIRAFHADDRPVLGICLGSQLVARAFGARAYKMPPDRRHTALPPCCAAAAGWDGGGSRSESKRGLEFGFLPQRFSPEALADPLLKPALSAMGPPDGPEGQWRFQLWHEDSFELPADAVVRRPEPPAASSGQGHSCTHSRLCTARTHAACRVQVLSQRPALEGDEALGGGGNEVGPNQAFRVGDATYAFQVRPSRPSIDQPARRQKRSQKHAAEMLMGAVQVSLGGR